MIKEVFNIFPTTIARFEYENHISFKKNLISLLDSVEESDKRVDNVLNSTHFFENSSKLLNLDIMQDFKKFLVESANSYVNDLMNYNTKMIITEGWINKTDQGYAEHMHNHANSFISATYYVNFDTEKHSALEFQQNKHKYNSLPFMMMKPTQYNEFNSFGFTFNDTQEGELLVWPSNLEHGFGPNKDNNRISIAVNFMPESISNGPYKFNIGLV